MKKSDFNLFRKQINAPQMKTVVIEPTKNKIGFDIESCSRLSKLLSLGPDIPLIFLFWSEVSVKLKCENFPDHQKLYFQ